MDDESPINTRSVVLSRSAHIVVMILIVLLLPLFQGHNDSQAVDRKEVRCTLGNQTASHGQGSVWCRENMVLSQRHIRAEVRFHPIIQKAADRYRIESALVKAIIMVESSYNPKAVSNRGAKGLMQLMPRTAESLGVEDIFNPEHNINAGVRYFRKLLNQFDGNMEMALAAYNAGSRKVRQYDGVPPFKATRRYLKKISEYYHYYKETIALETNSA